jgi:PIN domain nuclease of toxin-antitoxin system
MWLSPLSVWELLFLIERRRVTVRGEAPSWAQAALRVSPLREARLTSRWSQPMRGCAPQRREVNLLDALQTVAVL